MDLIESAADPDERAGPDRLALRAVPLLVAAVTFASGLQGGFVLDDRPAITDNPVVTGALPWLAALTRNFWGTPFDVPPRTYRPLASLVFRVELAALGPSPVAFHVVSLALYLGALYVAHRLARVWVGPRAACAAMCLFATMPLHVENVSSVVGQADLLSFGASLGALLVLRPSLTGGRSSWRRIGVACALYLTAVLFKESAAILPLIALAFVAWAALRPARPRLAPVIALAATGAAYLAIRLALIPRTFDSSHQIDDVLVGASAWQRIVFSSQIAATTARLVVAPVDLCIGRKYAEVSLPTGLGLHALAGLALAALAAWRTWVDWRERRAPLVLSTVLAWLLFSSLVLTVSEPMADRFMLLPTFFLCVAGVRAVARLETRPWLKEVLLALAVLTQAIIAGRYAWAWRTDEALLGNAVLSCPDSVHNHYRLAMVLSADGDPVSAVWHYAVASRGRGRFPGEWHHPAATEEQMLDPRELVFRMHSLLQVPVPEAAWRAGMAEGLRAQGMEAEARVALSLAPP